MLTVQKATLSSGTPLILSIEQEGTPGVIKFGDFLFAPSDAMIARIKTIYYSITSQLLEPRPGRFGPRYRPRVSLGCHMSHLAKNRRLTVNLVGGSRSTAASATTKGTLSEALP